MTEEQLRAWSEKELARAKADWSNSILEICKVCKKFYKATLTDGPAPKICPDCRRANE